MTRWDTFHLVGTHCFVYQQMPVVPSCSRTFFNRYGLFLSFVDNFLFPNMYVARDFWLAHRPTSTQHSREQFSANNVSSRYLLVFLLLGYSFNSRPCISILYRVLHVYLNSLGFRGDCQICIYTFRPYAKLTYLCNVNIPIKFEQHFIYLHIFLTFTIFWLCTSHFFVISFLVTFYRVFFFINSSKYMCQLAVLNKDTA